jgi:hypothetical protein
VFKKLIINFKSFKIKRVVLLLFLCSSFVFFSQTNDQVKIDSLKSKFYKDSLHLFRFQKLRPFLGIDQRNSWIKNESGTKNVPINVNGLQLGVILKENHTVGFGIYNITNTSKQAKKITDKDQRVTYQNLKLSYFTLFYQYVIIDKRYFELDLPLEIGLGNYNYYLSDSAQNILPKSIENNPFRLTGGGVNIVLKPFRWIGVTAMGGYRFAILDKNSHLNLNGPYYSYGVWLDIRQIYRDINFYWVKRPKYRKQLKSLQFQG